MASNTTGRGTGKGSQLARKRAAARRRKKRIIFAVEIVVVLILIVVLYFVTQLDKIHKDEIVDEEILTVDQSEIEDLLVEEDEITINSDITGMDGYRNIALFGVDARNNNLGKGARSDTILVASINQNTKEVKLASIYRDTYLNVGNDTYNKANSAYAYGGPKQAINMLNMNFDLNITDYVTVGWAAVADTVDALGGVEIDVDSAEITHLNNYQVETSQSLGRKYSRLTQTGYVTLDGIQAVSYCRIRYTAGDDYKRAMRQREVIKAIADKAKKADPAKLNDIANKVFPQTATSLELSEILTLLEDIANYEITETTGFPVQEYRASGKVGGKGDCVIPADLSVNAALLHEFLFGSDTGYRTSQAVENYAAKIRSDTGTSQVTYTDDNIKGYFEIVGEEQAESTTSDGN
ncbi:MAG: LCP family protein [Lachnospiraceae bacterium]|nr:LCP family protein [Lachnospiraceae bacterium]